MHVRQKVDLAIGNITTALNGDYATSEMKGWIDRWFHGIAVGETAPTQAQAGTIRDNFQAVADGLDNSTIAYKNKGDEAGYEDLYGWNTGSEIHIGALYFSGDARDRFGTVIHELTHFVTGDDDYAYFENPESFTGLTVLWKTPNVTTAQLIDNLDSYAGFLSQFYFGI